MSGSATPVSTRRPWRVALAGLVGTTIEYYDFFIYALAAALVFGPQFFPNSSEFASTLAALSTFAVGMIARPIGGVLLGHFGDRVGRKRILVLSLIVMGSVTALIGVLPNYAAIGVAAPIILVTLRLVQGLAVGGEWGGATLLALEHARSPRQRTLFSSLPQMGLPLGVVLGSVVFLAVRLATGEEAFVAWGWRIPFLASALLVAFGLALRLRLDESPEFKRVQARHRVRRAPLVDVLRTPRVWVPASGVNIASSTFGNVLLVFLLTYAASRQLHDASTMLWATVISAVVWTFAIPFAAVLAGRRGRKPVMTAATLAAVLWAFPFFWLVDTGTVAGLYLAATVTGGLIGLAVGPYGALVTEAFPPEVRYTGSSVAYGIGGVLGGAIAPLVATLIYGATGGTAGVAAYLAVASVVSLVAIVMLSSPHRDGSVPPDPADPVDSAAPAADLAPSASPVEQERTTP